MVPKHSVEMLSSVSNCEKAMMSLLEKNCVLVKLLSSMNYSAAGCEFDLINQLYQINVLRQRNSSYGLRIEFYEDSILKKYDALFLWGKEGAEERLSSSMVITFQHTE